MATQLFTKDMNREISKHHMAQLVKKNRAQITEQLTYDGMR